MPWVYFCTLLSVQHSGTHIIVYKFSKYLLKLLLGIPFWNFYRNKPILKILGFENLINERHLPLLITQKDGVKLRSEVVTCVKWNSR